MPGKPAVKVQNLNIDMEEEEAEAVRLFALLTWFSRIRSGFCSGGAADLACSRSSVYVFSFLDPAGARLPPMHHGIGRNRTTMAAMPLRLPTVPVLQGQNQYRVQQSMWVAHLIVSATLTRAYFNV
jgi:hypothetical protein